MLWWKPFYSASRRPIGDVMVVLKVVELIGTSEESFDDALRRLVKRSCKTVRGIKGVHIVDQKVHCDGKGNIEEYRVVCKVAFKVE